MTEGGNTGARHELYPSDNRCGAAGQRAVAVVHPDSSQSREGRERAERTQRIRFASVAPWVHSGGSSGTVTPSRLSRIRSSTLSTPMKLVSKSLSTPNINKAAQQPPEAESEEMNTIPDPRAPAPPQIVVSRNNSTDSTMHPDLSQEVATLSTKLINAINHQTTLDDTIQQTRHERDATKEKLAKVELRLKVHEEKMFKGLVVDRVILDKMEKQMRDDLEEEKRRRVAAELAKRKTDSEVEQLTAALFEEANVMVAAARKETEASEKRNEQLKQQLRDAETLQLSLQEQLQDLKGVMEKMSTQGDDESHTLATTTAPSTPGIMPADKMNKLFDATTPNTPGTEDITPEHPLHFSHLIHPVLRSDLTSFREFQDMLKVSARSTPNSRASSGNYGSLTVLGLGSLTNNSTSSLPSAKSPNSTKSRESSISVTSTNLKDEKFYKRALSEDIEPTLRLDIAPGVSWMARRSILSSITAASLVVEPNPPPPKFRGPVFSCALCGEARKGDQYARRFRFKTSETDDTRYPLCDWCLGRIRSTCDYVSFLRMVAAGHWRAETEEERQAAWEESVRLRERMFWARIGGGVVPSFVPMRESPRSPTFANDTGKLDAPRKSGESQVSDQPLDSTVDISAPPKEARKSEEDPFRSDDHEKVKRVSIGKTVISNPEKGLTEKEERQIELEAEAQLQSEVRKSFESETAEIKLEVPRQRPMSTPMSLSPPQSPILKESRLSLAIPGAF
ncbi:Sec2p-domain-containing protein [Massarina eburnea CBS 473.64]|uniref:Sec2p-domain-containing protein n=1 Tax=Massarina eburnea CBS 473.64 TaxID=1395130 RepID=A0A6A6S7E1_9PLEO|nr:Sec2p-domain-containing protein [Massarina eburnea CBS 473.64]